MASILVFGFDLGEAAQIRRIRGFLTLGHAVTSATFRRGNMNRDFRPDWPNVDLGAVPNERFGRRIALIAGAVLRMTREGPAVREADAMVARNFDMLAIAWVARLWHRRGDTPLIYECLDIHGLFTRGDTVGRVMRWCERRLLARTALLVVSSPAFLEYYFEPVQHYRGRAALLENKLWFDGPPVPRPAAPRVSAPAEPLRLGWIGSIRCAESARILFAAADAMGGALHICIHGNIHRHALPDFERELADRPNVAYHGPYRYPEGLAAAYGSCDLVWAQDLWQRGANSDWLLPNRIYEASWFGCPSVAVAETETGRRVIRDGLGFTLPAGRPEALVKLLSDLDRDAIRRASAALLARAPQAFQLSPAEMAAALAPVVPPVPATR